MIISQMTDTVNTIHKEINSISDICVIIKSASWAPGVFKNNYRNTQNFESTLLMVLDVDKECSLDNAIRTFSPYRHIIATTKSHQKDKNGLTCDRFRVLLFLDQAISDSATYYATWFSLFKLFPFIDEQCKDPARFFYASPGEPIINNSGLLITPTKPEQLPVTRPKLKTVPSGDRGKLARSTLSFLLEGAAPGSWNQSLFKAAKDYYEQGYEQEDFIEKAEKITGHLDEKDLKTIESAFKQEPKYDPRYGRDGATFDLIHRCYLYINSIDVDDTRLIDHSSGEIHPIAIRNIRLELGTKGFQSYAATRAQNAVFVYEPHRSSTIWKADSGLTMFNDYQPPEWKRSTDEIGALPAIYQRFFDHLTGGDERSFTYLVDWLANSIQSRNYCILCAIGDPGIGKGVLGEIMQRLHGANNYAKVRDSIFKLHFNAPLANKTLIYVDEAVLDTKESTNRIKDVVNDHIEVEKKGKDARWIRNWASFYLSSNDRSAIYLEKGDRRFSLLDLTKVPLIQRPELIAELPVLLAGDSIKQLGLYLSKKKIDSDMLRVFLSKSTEEVKDASLAEWESYVIYDLAPKHSGKEISLTDIQEKVKAVCDMRNTIGRRKFQLLAERYPQVLDYRNNNGRVRIIFLSK